MKKNTIFAVFIALVVILGVAFVIKNRQEGKLVKTDIQPMVLKYSTYPPGFPKELSRELVRFETAEATMFPDGSQQIILKYESPNQAEALRSLYKQTLESASWSISESKEKGNEKQLSAQKNFTEDVTYTLTSTSSTSTSVSVIYKIKN